MTVPRILKSVLVAAVLTSAAYGGAGGQTEAEPIYLPAGAVDAETLIDPPPAVGSVAFNQQMAIVLWLQKTRTSEQVVFVETELTVERFAPVLGEALFAVDGAELKRVIDTAISEVRQAYDATKDAYSLPRPFEVSTDVHPVGDARPVASYPSGHAIRAIVYARLLAEVFPDRSDALLDLAYRVGYGRVIAGVHYPIDVTSGQTLGNAYADAIVESPAFLEALARVTAKN